MSNFEPPKTWASYHREIILRSKLFIERGIWHGISQSVLEGWLQNFKTNEEKYLAACLLDCFVYRSRAQIEAMYRYLFTIIFPNYSASGLGPGITSKSAFFAPLFSGLPGKSEHVYFRILTGVIRLPEARQITISEEFLNSQPKQPIILIDDFCGTGRSFNAFATKFKIKALPSLKIVFCPLLAHQNGIDAITAVHHNVAVLPVERLGSQASVFSPESFIFDHSGAAREFYLSFIRGKGLRDTQFPLGFGDQELALAFEESIPNETLPILVRHNGLSPCTQKVTIS